MEGPKENAASPAVPTTSRALAMARSKKWFSAQEDRFKELQNDLVHPTCLTTTCYSEGNLFKQKQVP